MRQEKLLIRPLLAGACAVALLAGCSSTPVPKEQFAVGKASLESAQTAGAAELAPVELNRAREKLAQAQIAMNEERFEIARMLAEQADADAKVAYSKANAERSRRAAEEINAGLRTLRQQLNSSGDAALMPTAPAAGSATQPSTVNPDMDPPLRNAPGEKPQGSGSTNKR